MLGRSSARFHHLAKLKTTSSSKELISSSKSDHRNGGTGNCITCNTGGGQGHLRNQKHKFRGIVRETFPKYLKTLLQDSHKPSLLKFSVFLSYAKNHQGSVLPIYCIDKTFVDHQPKNAQKLAKIVFQNLLILNWNAPFSNCSLNSSIKIICTITFW